MKKTQKEYCQYCKRLIKWSIDEYATDTVYPKKGLGVSKYYHVECDKKYWELKAHEQQFDYHGRN